MMKAKIFDIKNTLPSILPDKENLESAKDIIKRISQKEVCD
ncbi:MAG: hypothetical protein UHN02_03060 [Acutalibacteraceae bacterium]|nr:hypothetical protein [Acutalibacteraceae bacterium]